MIDLKIRESVRRLRGKGKTFLEINKILGLSLPKSTISYISKGVRLPNWYSQDIAKRNLENLNQARQLSVLSRHRKMQATIKAIENGNLNLLPILANKQGAKLILTILYLAEGSKTKRSSVMFGNSDPMIVELLLGLLRRSYNVDESKLRVTVQGRSDQEFNALEKFWSKVTRIPRRQFYKARVDPRSIGKKSIKSEYMGVCRIDYFSASVDLELKIIAQLISKKYHGPIV